MAREVEVEEEEEEAAAVAAAEVWVGESRADERVTSLDVDAVFFFGETL